jgi:hypothetical protein
MVVDTLQLPFFQRHFLTTTLRLPLSARVGYSHLFLSVYLDSHGVSALAHYTLVVDRASAFPSHCPFIIHSQTPKKPSALARSPQFEPCILKSRKLDHLANSLIILYSTWQPPPQTSRVTEGSHASSWSLRSVADVIPLSHVY